MLNERQSVFAFKNSASANDCKQFLERYKTMHGFYPRTTPGKDFRVVPELGIPIVRLEDLTRLQQKCQVAQLGLVGIDSFSYDISRTFTNIKFTGENFEDDMQLDIDHAKVLEILYKMSL